MLACATTEPSQTPWVAYDVLLIGLLGLCASGVFRVKTPEGTLVVEVNVPNPDVYVDGEPRPRPDTPAARVLRADLAAQLSDDFSRDGDCHREDRVSLGFFHWGRFPGQRMLINHRIAIHHNPIDRHLLSRTHYNQVILFQIGDLALDFLAID
jgi:hypothetical protein